MVMTVGRPLEYDADEVVAAAMSAFWRQGFTATSLRDLLAATGLSKSSLYQGFDSKRRLFERCVARYRDDMSVMLLGWLDEAPSGRAFIERVLTWVADTAGTADGRKGCLLVNSANEIGRGDRELSRAIEKGMERFVDVFARAVRRAQAEEDIDAGRDPDVVARFLVTAMCGLRTLVKAGADRDQTRSIVGLTMHAL